MVAVLCLVPRIQQRFALGVAVNLAIVTALLMLTADKVNEQLVDLPANNKA
jgi:hypothetical protein